MMRKPPLFLLAVLLSVSCQGKSSRPGSSPESAPAAARSAEAKPAANASSANAAANADSKKIDSARAMLYLREIVAFGRRADGSEGQKKQQAYLRAKLKNDGLIDDAFTAETPAGRFEMHNLIARFPGSSNDIIVIASHYDTCYPLKDYIGANDGGSSTALLLELANQLRGARRTGPAVWLVWFDGEEAFRSWSRSDSLYGSRHLAAKWKQDGTLSRIKAFILADMIGDADLNIDRDENSTAWLSELVLRSAESLGVQSHFYARRTPIEDDHLPFIENGVAAVDLIDLDYGYGNVFHHTSQDTLDKVSPRSLEIVGNVILETVRRLSLPGPGPAK